MSQTDWERIEERRLDGEGTDVRAVLGTVDDLEATFLIGVGHPPPVDAVALPVLDGVVRVDHDEEHVGVL